MSEYIGGLVVLGVGFGLVFVYMALALARFERRLADTKDKLRELNKQYWALSADFLGACNAAGLIKMPKKDPEWVKAGPPPAT